MESTAMRTYIEVLERLILPLLIAGIRARVMDPASWIGFSIGYEF